MSSSLLNNLNKIEKLKNRSNYKLWRSRIVAILEIEGLWRIVSGTRTKPSVTPDSETSPELEAWTTDARRAWVTIELSLSDEIQYISSNFERDDPVGLWNHLERKYLPCQGVEASRL